MSDRYCISSFQLLIRMSSMFFSKMRIVAMERKTPPSEALWHRTSTAGGRRPCRYWTVTVASLEVSPFGLTTTIFRMVAEEMSAGTRFTVTLSGLNEVIVRSDLLTCALQPLTKLDPAMLSNGTGLAPRGIV